MTVKGRKSPKGMPAKILLAALGLAMLSGCETTDEGQGKTRPPGIAEPAG